MKGFWLCASLSCLLAACSTLVSDPSTPPRNAALDLTLIGTGHQQFQCSSDSKGYFWRFVAPEVTLRDETGRVLARQGVDFAFIALDGSRLKAKIVASSARSWNSQMKDVLFETTPHGLVRGKLTPYHWVRRTDAEGGIPLRACSKTALGQFIRIPFRATYRFYR